MTKKTLEKPALAYTIQEFAAATGLGVTTIRDAIRDGHIIPSYFGTKPLISAEEGKRFINDLPAEKQ
jgi:excisionase family DNA binding protein